MEYKAFAVVGRSADGRQVYLCQERDMGNFYVSNHFSCCKLMPDAESAFSILIASVAKAFNLYGKQLSTEKFEIRPVDLHLTEVNKNDKNQPRAYGHAPTDPVFFYAAYDPKQGTFIGAPYKMYGTIGALAAALRTPTGYSIYNRTQTQIEGGQKLSDIANDLNTAMPGLRFETTKDILLARPFETPTGPEHFELGLPAAFKRYACKAILHSACQPKNMPR